MLRFKYTYLIIIVMAFSFACKKDVEENIEYNNVIYQIDTQKVYGSSAEKTRQKSTEQFVSILFLDVFNQSISTNELYRLSELYLANGDKHMVTELIVSSYINSASAQIPTDAQMRADIDQFVDETYIRFLQRNPNPYEKQYLSSYIANNATVTVKIIYTVMILSNEYNFY